MFNSLHHAKRSFYLAANEIFGKSVAYLLKKLFCS